MGVGYWRSGVERVETVALYLQDGRPTHAARQLPNGKWTNKLGQDVDVVHDQLEEILTWCEYGKPAVFLRRPRQ